MRRELIPTLLKASPNAAHRALADLEQMGKLKAVITQNIDGLHQQAGTTRVIELHGTNRSTSGLSCGRSWAIESIQQRLEGGDLDPRCDSCDGLIKPDTVSFGQALPEQTLIEAFALAKMSDLMLMIGSSLEVQPAASIPAAVHQAGAALIFINRTAPPGSPGRVGLPRGGRRDDGTTCKARFQPAPINHLPGNSLDKKPGL